MGKGSTRVEGRLGRSSSQTLARKSASLTTAQKGTNRKGAAVENRRQDPRHCQPLGRNHVGGEAGWIETVVVEWDMPREKRHNSHLHQDVHANGALGQGQG